MGAQAQGVAGWIVDRMIRRSVRRTFHSLYWIPPLEPLTTPVILVPNHHGWHDGYVMYHVVTALGLPVLDWIAEFDAFPLFRAVGGMPFPADDVSRRASTIRQTIRRMRSGERGLVVFAEGTLHMPPAVLPLGKALEMVADKVPGAQVVPVGIRYEMATHERPECHVIFGGAVERGPELGVRTRLAMKTLLDLIEVKVRFSPDEFQVLARGTLDVNERMDMRRIPKLRK